MLTPRDDTSSKCFLLGNLWGSQLLLIKREVSQTWSKGLAFKISREGEMWWTDEVLGLSDLLKTIIVTLTPFCPSFSFMVLIGNAIRSVVLQLPSRPSGCLLTVSKFQCKKLFFRTELWVSPYISPPSEWKPRRCFSGRREEGMSTALFAAKVLNERLQALHPL